MKLNIADLLCEPGKKAVHHEELDCSDKVVVAEEISVKTPVKLVFAVEHLGRGLIEFNGNYEVDLKLRCGRCLKPLKASLKKALKAIYTPDDFMGELELDDKQHRLSYQQKKINIWELLKQDFVVTVPMLPLCNENCRGLCKVCGKDLNESSCDHQSQQESIDPRLKKLQQLDLD